MKNYSMYEVGENLWVEPLVSPDELKSAYHFIFDNYLVKGESSLSVRLEYEMFQSGRIKIYALMYNDQLVGVTGLWHHFHTLKEIKYAFIHPDHQGAGLFLKIFEIIKEEHLNSVILCRSDAFNKPMNISLVKAGFQFLSLKDNTQIVWGLNSRSNFQPQLPQWLTGASQIQASDNEVKILSTDKDKMIEALRQGFVPSMKEFKKYKLFVYLCALEKLRRSS